MMSIIKICGIIGATALISLIIKEHNPSIAKLLGVIGTVLAGIYAVRCVAPLIEYTNSLSEVSSDILGILIKVLGISYLSDFSASLCKDVGETSLSTAVELCGKIQIILLSMPMFKNLIEFCTSVT